MPATIGDLLLAHGSTATLSLPSRAKDPSANSSDFGEQLKDARQAQSKTSAPEAPTRKESAKLTKAKPVAKKKAKPAADDDGSDAGADTAPTPDAKDEVAGPPVLDGSTDEASEATGLSDDAPNASTVKKADPTATPPTAASLVIASQVPPQVEQLRAQRAAELKSKGGKALPLTTDTAKPTEEARTDAVLKEASEDDEAPTSPTADAEDVAKPVVVKKSMTPAVDPLDPAAPKPTAAQTAAKAAARAAPAVQPVADNANVSATAASPVAPDTDDDNDDAPASMLPAAVAASIHMPTGASKGDNLVAPQPAPEAAQEARFAKANHETIVTDVRSAMTAKGGTMQIRLDPPELGALQVSVEMRDGTMNATFQTSNDEATRLLGHSLGQLKTALEAQGVTVDKISVQQTPRDQQAKGDTSQQQQREEAQGRQQDQQRDQQRRDLLEKMWAKVSGQSMPMDLVA